MVDVLIVLYKECHITMNYVKGTDEVTFINMLI